MIPPSPSVPIDWTDHRQFAHLTFAQLKQRDDVDWGFVLHARRFPRCLLADIPFDMDLWRIMRDPATQCPCPWMFYSPGCLTFETDDLEHYWDLLDLDLLAIYVRLTPAQLCHFYDRLDIAKLETHCLHHGPLDPHDPCLL